MSNSNSSSGKSMRVAIATTDGTDIDLHFGHAEYFYIYERKEPTGWTFIESRETGRFCTKESNHGKNNGVRERFGKILSDCEILLCESIGYHVAADLESRGIRPYMLECGVDDGLSAVEEGMLEYIAIAQD